MFVDKASGVKSDRPGLEQALDTVANGDTLVVWRLDRLGRSMQHLVTVVQDLNDRGVGFRSLRDGAIDTTTASGQLIFGIFAALAQFERALIVERTNAGLAAARARGLVGGRWSVVGSPLTREIPESSRRKLCTQIELSLSVKSARPSVSERRLCFDG